MSQVLYRKYRAKDFSEIVGQEHIVKVLQKSIEKDNPAHAYLFCGPRGTGKTSIARIFASGLNGGGDVSMLDVIEVDAASNRGINEIRELKERSAFAPTASKYKVYIIDEVHMLTKEAFNAILKTLEEPPDHTIFIMATTEVHKIPMTILSRVVRFDFRLASNEELREKLSRIIKAEKKSLDKNSLETIIRLARGSFRDAESLLQKILDIAGKDKKISDEEVAKVLGIALLSDIEKIVDQVLVGNSGLSDLHTKLLAVFDYGVNPQQFLQDLAEEVLRRIVSTFDDDGAEALRKRRTLFRLSGVIQELLTSYNYFVDPLIIVRLAILNVAAGSDSLPQQAISRTIGQSSIIKTPKQQKTSQIEEKSQQAGQMPDKEHTKKEFAKTVEIELLDKPESADVLDHIVLSIRTKDVKLATIISQGKLIDSTPDIQIVVPYKFHLDRLNEVKNKSQITKILNDLKGQDVKLTIVQDSNLHKKTLQSANSDKTVVMSAGTSTAQTGNSISSGANLGDESTNSNQDIVEEIFSDII